MDTQTLAIYDQNASAIAAHHRRGQPDESYQRMLTYFQAGASTADIGCGSGRDTAWLAARHFPVVGWDGSTGMLAEARQSYPHIQFEHSTLPDLAQIPDSSYVNLVCNAVLMHLPRHELPTAAASFYRILQPGGRIVLTWWPSRSETEREDDERLFSEIKLPEMQTIFAQAGLIRLQSATQDDTHAPGKRWYWLVAERP